MLVPIPPSNETTRFDVQYPQARGALPPGLELPYEEGDPIPPGYRLLRQKRRGLIIAGSIVLGVPWALGVTAATGADFRNDSGLLLVPALGPWLMLATKGARDKSCTGGDLDCNRAGLRAALVFDGLVQAAGTTLLIVGLTVPRVRLVRRDVTVSVLPAAVGPRGFGAVLGGSF